MKNGGRLRALQGIIYNVPDELSQLFSFLCLSLSTNCRRLHFFHCSLAVIPSYDRQLQVARIAPRVHGLGLSLSTASTNVDNLRINDVNEGGQCIIVCSLRFARSKLGFIRL